jgi:hypothetical protein
MIAEGARNNAQRVEAKQEAAKILGATNGSFIRPCAKERGSSMILGIDSRQREV